MKRLLFQIVPGKILPYNKIKMCLKCIFLLVPDKNMMLEINKQVLYSIELCLTKKLWQNVIIWHKLIHLKHESSLFLRALQPPLAVDLSVT